MADELVDLIKKKITKVARENMPTPKQAALFAVLPIEGRDFAQFSDQFSVLHRFIAHSFKRLDLLPEEYVSRGIFADLTAASAVWMARWGEMLAAAWTNNPNKGLGDRLKAVGKALISDKTAVRDTTAIAHGWVTIATFWVLILYLLLHYAIPAAHAQSAAGNGTGNGDLAGQALGLIFPFWGGATALAQALGQVAAVLGKISLSLAGIGTVWTCIIMAIETGASWESAKQRYSVIMFGLRVGVSLAMLAPSVTANSSGYNNGQKMAGHIAMWGSNQTSQAWTGMAGKLTQTGNLVGQPMVSEMEIEQTVAALAKDEACMAGVNLDPARNQNESVTPNANSDFFSAPTLSYDHYAKNFFKHDIRDLTGGCGIVTFVKPTTTGASAVSSSAVSGVADAQKSAFNALQQTIRSDISGIIQNHIDCRDSTDNTGCANDPDPSITVKNWVATYRQAVASNITTAITSANASAAQQLSNGSTSQGWVGAGAYAMTLSQLQSSLDGAAAALPRVTPPNMKNPPELEAIAETFIANGNASGATPIGAAMQDLNSGSQHAGDNFFRAVISGGGTLAMLPQLNSMSPLAGMSTLGRYTYEAGLAMKVASALFLDDGKGGVSTSAKIGTKIADIASDLIPGASIAKTVAKGALEAVRPFIDPLIFVGIALAYFVPALPFIRFFFAVVLWMIAVVETVFLINCGLVLMIQPEHGGLFGSAAKGMLWNVVALALRPILILAGFVAGLEVLSAAIGILNTLMLPMMTANEATSSATGNWTVVGWLAYLVIYLGIAYVTTNTCSKLAEMLPNAAYRWLNANGAGERDDASAIAGVLGATMARFGRLPPSKPKTT